ncbi:MAG: polysaccharide biosynthesis tyrosine autokinase [Pirellulales bacterium]|nr:polysaccharide biosynthesis tyrosine autokinase [Pirellulales bacterium]
MSDFPDKRPPARALSIVPKASIAQQAAGGSSLGPKDPLTLNFVLRALQQWWKIALPLALILSSTAVIIAWISFELSYRASAWLQIKEQQEYLAFRSERDGQRFSQTQLELIRGPIVLERLLSTPKISKLPEVNEQTDPLEWLKKRLTVKNVGGSELFEVSFAGPNPENSAMIVNSIVDSYLDVTSRDNAAQRMKVVELLNKQKDRWANEVKNARDTVRSLAKQITNKDPFIDNSDRQTTVIGSPLAVLQGMLIHAEVDRTILEAETQALKETLNSEKLEVSEQQLQESIAEHQEIQHLKADLEADQSALVAVEKKAGPASKEYVEHYRHKVENDQQKLATRTSQLREEMRQKISALDKLQRDQLIHDKEIQLTNLIRQHALLQDRVTKELKNQVQSQGDTVELEFAKGELEQAEGVFQRISDRVLALTTESVAPERVVLQKPASVPAAPEEKSPLKMAGMAGLAAFFLPFALAIAWERRVKRILDAQQILEESYLPVAGEVAALPIRRLFGRARGARNLSRARYVFEESIDSLRTSLVLSDELRDLQIIAVVSSVSREGKTSLSAQLAVSLARACNQPVLLIDADIRSPDLHQIFEVPLEPGLVKVLNGQNQPPEAIQLGKNQLVHLLPAGRLHKSPHTLMGHGAFKTLLDQFRPNYRYIVVDTPPVLSASESLVVAKAADGALLCTLRETSRAPQVKLTYDRLLRAGANVIGVVLSGVPTSHYAHKYGSYAYNHR